MLLAPDPDPEEEAAAVVVAATDEEEEEDPVKVKTLILLDSAAVEEPVKIVKEAALVVEAEMV